MASEVPQLRAFVTPRQIQQEDAGATAGPLASDNGGYKFDRGEYPLKTWLSRALFLLSTMPMLVSHCNAQQQTPETPLQQDTVRMFVQGDSSRLRDFVESCKREFSEHGMKLQLVRPDEGYEYNIVVAQESSVSGAAAAVIALDGKGMFVASVVRSGRWSGKGAFNASAKELAKKLLVLRNR